MRLLVTGGCGFIGSHFIRTVLRERPDWEIVNLDALTYAGNLANVADIQADHRYKFVYGSITDQVLLQSVVPLVDHVVNFAAETHVDRSIYDNEPFILTNILGVQRVIDACVQYDTPLHHVSTDEVFGELEHDGDKFSESSPYQPRNPYSATKAASDHLIRAAVNTRGLRATISNCTNNYGPYLYPEKFLSIAITNLLEGSLVPIHGDGGQVRDWIHAEDHSRGVLKIIEQGTAGETYMMGGNAEYSILGTAQLLLQVMGLREDRLQFIVDRPGQDRRYAIDFSKITRELDWKPQYTFETGLAQMISWYQKNPGWWKPIKESAAYRQWYTSHFGPPTAVPAASQQFIRAFEDAPAATPSVPLILTKGAPKVMILGSRGFLGEYLRQSYPDAVCPSLDIGSQAAVDQIMREHKPDILINAAGKTGRPNVDWCETHQEETFHANVVGPLVLAEAAQKQGAYMVHLGSGCIYEGDNGGRGYSETDLPNFRGSYYSKTKLWSDEMLQEFPVLIIRLRMPFDSTRHERNLLMKLLKYPRVMTAQNSLTYLPDMFFALEELIRQRATGAFNMVNPGSMSPYQVMTIYREMVDPSHHFEPLQAEDILTAVKTGRSNCVLSNKRLEAAGILLPTAEQRIRETFEAWRSVSTSVLV